MKDRITSARYRALATVNRELVALYWDIGRIIDRQQETAKWGDAVVEQLSADLRAAFPDMKGFSRDNVFRMRQFFLSCRKVDAWVRANVSEKQLISAPQVPLPVLRTRTKKVATAPRQFGPTDATSEVATVSRQFGSVTISELIASLSWSHHKEILGISGSSCERYFFMAMSVRERWSVRELRRQIDSGLFLRYMSVRRDPEKCLPTDADQGDLLPFKDHYILEFLGLEDE